MGTKYEYPDGIAGDAEAMKKYRREMRKGRTPEEIEAARRNPSTPKTSTMVTPHQQSSEDGLGGEDLLKYTEDLVEVGLKEDNGLDIGYGFTIAKRPSVSQLMDKFRSRWNQEPSIFRWLSPKVVILGPLPQ